MEPTPRTEAISPELSVIVPVWNAEATLAEQLDALAGMPDRPSFEVIVADNGSTDGSMAIAESYRTRFARFQIVDASGRKGAAHARNVGAGAARGAYLAFCDADDVAGDRWTVAIVRALGSHELVASRFDGDLLNDADTLRLRSCPQQTGPMEFRYARFLPFAGACGLALHASVFHSLGGFDTELLNGEDIDFCWRAQLAGWDLHFEPAAVMHIRLRAEPATLYQQTRSYGFWTVPLYQRYRGKGMPRVPWTQGLARWLRLLRRLPYVVRTPARRRWRRDFAYAMGLLAGSLRYRIFAL